MDSRSPASDSLEGFAAFCRLLVLEDGSPFELHDFQRRMVSDYFGGARETLVLVSKKNGKSTLLSALALHHLLVTRDAECVIAAAARDQAEILLRQSHPNPRVGRSDRGRCDPDAGPGGRTSPPPLRGHVWRVP